MIRVRQLNCCLCSNCWDQIPRTCHVPWGPGFKSRMCPPYPKRDRKRRLNGAVCRNHRIKRLVPCRCFNGHVKEPYEMSTAWEPDRRSNFFFIPPAHLCAVTYMTEISLIVTLNNQITTTWLDFSPRIPLVAFSIFLLKEGRQVKISLLIATFVIILCHDEFNITRPKWQPPWGRRGLKSRIRPPYTQPVVKGD